MKPLTKILALLTLAVMLLTGCAGEGATGITIPSSQTKQPSTTTAATTESYRPDLAWAQVTVAVPSISQANPLSYTWDTQAIINNGDGGIPLYIYVSGYSPPDSDLSAFCPTEYTESLGWETLPKDAWNSIDPEYPGRTYVVAPAGTSIENFSVADMLAFYGSDSAIIEENNIQVIIYHVVKKVQ